MARTHTLLFLACLLAGGGLSAQDQPVAPPPAAVKPAAKSPAAAPQHKFWDKENILLFTGVGGARMMDYASTRYLRDQGNYEWLLSNSVVDNRPLFVGIELAGTGLSVSYLFHRTGHHTLERWTSIVHIGVAVGGSIRNYGLKPPTQPLTAQPAMAIQAAP